MWCTYNSLRTRKRSKWILERGKVRSLGIHSRVEASRVVLDMAGSGLKRSGEILVHILWLVLYTLSHLVIITFRLIVDLGHKVPSIRIVKLSPPLLIPFVIFVSRSIVEYMTRKGISALSVLNWATCNEIILYSGCH